MHQFASFLKGLANFSLAEQTQEGDDSINYIAIADGELFELRQYYPEFSEANLPSILLIPSVINSEKIFDLTPNCSLAKNLAHNFQVFVIAWKEPSAEEPQSMANYTSAIAEAVNNIDGEPIALGYCFGGTLALKATLDYNLNLKQLVLLATPITMELVPAWAYWRQIPKWATKAYLEATPVISTELCRYYFVQLMWQEIIAKFAKREFMLPDDDEWKEFIALEKWLKSGVGLSGKLVEEVAQGINWPAELNTPYYVQMITASRDQVIPQAASQPLSGWEVPSQLSLNTGHLGLVLNAQMREAIVAQFKSMSVK